MCGIAGYVGTTSIPEQRVQSCLALMKSRGPDGCGRMALRATDGRQILVLHSRLAILDRDPRADQPMTWNGHLLAVNGELYNYRELASALTHLGPWRTSGDSEVMLRHLAYFGTEGLDRCEGMWAYIRVDQTSGAIELGRDRFGEKPLYLMQQPCGLFFGSEIKYIAALVGRWPAPDLEHLRRYLVNGYRFLHKGPNTFFVGVEPLPPATVLTIDPFGARQVRRYWTPPRDKWDETLGFEEAAQAVRTALIRSMSLRLRADVPIAFCLSGGIDSNALAAIAKREFGYDVHGFTIVNTDARYEESELVATAVGQLGLRHTPIAIETAGFLPHLRQQLLRHDGPICTLTYVLHGRMLEQIARDGYRVSISGTGADELFSGYYDHHNAYLADMARTDPARHAQALAEWHQWVRPMVRNPLLADADLFLRDPEDRRHLLLEADDFGSWLFTPFHQPFTEQTYSSSLLRNRMLNELLHESVPPILAADDLNAMSVSVENRSPYLDRDLFDLASRIPTRHLIRQGRAKAVLRAAMRGLVPDPILDTPRKVGFNAPILDLLNPRDAEFQHWFEAESPIDALVDRHRIKALLQRPELPNSASKFVFSYLNARLFLEAFGG